MKLDGVYSTIEGYIFIKDILMNGGNGYYHISPKKGRRISKTIP